MIDTLLRLHSIASETVTILLANLLGMSITALVWLATIDLYIKVVVAAADVILAVVTALWVLRKASLNKTDKKLRELEVREKQLVIKSLEIKTQRLVAGGEDHIDGA